MPKEELPYQAQNQDGSTNFEELELPESMETTKAELEEIRMESNQFKLIAQRAQADMINFRKRVEDERKELVHSITAQTITKLLPILDDLQRALDQAPSNITEETWLAGIRLIERSLESLLESMGVTLIEADGKAFDPWEHEAVFTTDSSDHEPGTIVSIVRPGYKLMDKVLRPVQVAVSSREHENIKPIEDEEPQS